MSLRASAPVQSPSLFQLLYDTIVVGISKYGANTWQDVPWEDHLLHAKYHIMDVLNAPTYWPEKTSEVTDEDLAHALCRLIYAIECRRVQETRYSLTENGEKKLNG